MCGGNPTRAQFDALFGTDGSGVMRPMTSAIAIATRDVC